MNYNHESVICNTDIVTQFFFFINSSCRVSQENLSPGNCVVATVFPKEIKSLPINVATVYLRKLCRHARDWHFILSAKACDL